MFLKTYLCLAAAAVSSVSAVRCPLPDFTQQQIDSGVALTGISSTALQNSFGEFKGGCNRNKLKLRQEWRTLAAKDRKSFISAVKCLQNKPSVFPAGVVPGSKSFFDDFVFVHMNQTLTIHLTGNFLTWHRYFIHTYEKELQKCGYNGNLPYWEWGYDVKAPRNSPVFDGSDTSLGSDGAAVPHQGMQIIFPGATEPLIFQPGTGGGCISKGPFKGMLIRLGPAGLPQYGSPNTTSVPDPSQDNPRCVKRDLNAWVAQKWTSFRNTTELILFKNTIGTFQSELTGDPRQSTNPVGAHGGGHYTMGGDPGADPFISPGDPAFYLHHAQVDRAYWIWQNLDFDNRQGVWGTTFFFDFIPSPNTTVNDLVDLSPLAPPVTIKSLMNTVGGPLCYAYV
ncbi:tyrosinase-like protein [Cercophora newfieldiana]|uniref:Tyrosinase-like protein n=1 Tax=Cercophora newfieldiana TaxID=92897 RepID=A0AA40CT75_9PEZI|nr:tyrosinase-like protein [Cercophora newfieldiana]